MEVEIGDLLSMETDSKSGQKCGKRRDTLWGAWFFFSFYFKAAVREEEESKDLNKDVFMVQHDMENMYMWAFKDRPENALGKMQLRSYMNGRAREGDPPFPFTPEKGFVRSHRMQRKRYRGLSNPQCLHAVEPVPAPDLSSRPHLRLRWLRLTGRPWDSPLPPEARDFASWRHSLAGGAHPLEPRDLGSWSGAHQVDAVSGLSLGARRFEGAESGPGWASHFTGAMKNVSGPVTAAKTIYEDERSYLIVVTLPCVELRGVRVSWRNTATHGVVKVSGVSNARVPFLKRRDRIFRLADPSSEHCPPGHFVREIPLSTLIFDGAELEAHYDGPRSLLEIVVPKLPSEPEEHEIRVCFRPKTGLTFA